VLFYLGIAVSAAIVAVVATPLASALAYRVGAIDEPGERRIHEGRIPRLGGLAVLLGSLAVVHVGGLLHTGMPDVLDGHGWRSGWFLGGLLVVTAVGLVDDIWRLRPVPKLAGQVVAATLAVLGGYAIRAITNPFTGDVVELGWMGTLITFVWIVGITNAFNLIDGLDGLAAGVGLIAGGTICLLAAWQQRPDVAVLAAALCGALGGFLLHNFHPASIFLGDCGAFLVGYTLAVLSIQGLQKGPTLAVVLVPILALGLPILDTAVAIVRRFADAGSGRVFRADSEHIHHRLALRTATQRHAVLILYGVSAVLGLGACLAVLLGGPGSAVLAVAVGIAVYLGLRALGYLD